MIRPKNSKIMLFDPEPQQIEIFLAQKNEELLCGICYRNKCDAVLSSCGHCEICIECAKKSFSLKRSCPFCRSV